MPEAKEPTETLYQPQPGPQTDFHSRNEDFVLYGGAKGGGKSLALLFEATRQCDKPNYHAIILRRTYPRLQELIDRAKLFFPKLGWKWEGEARRFRAPSGASIAFGHCEHEDDKYNYQGHEYAFIGFDQLEEFTEGQFTFLRAQNRCSDPTIDCYIRATANPGGVGHWWIKRRFIDQRKPGVTYEDVFDMPGGKKVSLTWIYIKSTIYDNPILLKAQPTYLANLMGLSDVEKRALLDGDWNAYTTACIFDSAGMVAQQGLVVEPAWRGFLRDGGEFPEFVLDDKGRLHVWQHPVDGRRYLITADVAKGVEGGDYSGALVYDRFKKEVVAKWYGHVDALEYGKHLFGLGTYYNNAIIAVEVWPGPGIATGSKLQEMHYPNLYKRKVWDGMKRVEKEEVGWTTDQSHRNEAIAALQLHIKMGKMTIRDQATLDEMLSFIRNGKTGKAEAQSGCHDDLVVCAFIASYIFEFEPGHDRLGADAPEAPILAQRLVRLPTSSRQKMIAGMRSERL